MTADRIPTFTRVSYRGRNYTVIYVGTDPLVSVDYARWAGLGQIQTQRTLKRGPTRTAVIALAAKELA